MYGAPEYGVKIQYATVDNSNPLSSTHRIHKVVGKFLFMARAMDSTLLHASNDIACNISKVTQATLEATNHVLNYIACHQTPQIWYRANDMIVHVDSDAAYLVCPEASCSNAGGSH